MRACLSELVVPTEEQNCGIIMTGREELLRKLKEIQNIKAREAVAAVTTQQFNHSYQIF